MKIYHINEYHFYLLKFIHYLQVANDIAGYDPAKVLSMTVGYQCVVAEKCGKISFLSILCHPIF